MSRLGGVQIMCAHLAAVDNYDMKYIRIAAPIYGHRDLLGLITEDALVKAMDGVTNWELLNI